MNITLNPVLDASFQDLPLGLQGDRFLAGVQVSAHTGKGHGPYGCRKGGVNPALSDFQDHAERSEHDSLFGGRGEHGLAGKEKIVGACEDYPYAGICEMRSFKKRKTRGER